ncbi:LysR substrate-binding domain-containing protein [Paraburkholderia diazotrophica]|uniref:Transcriptional regulator, LysR family n=1 Tax=Paraburkholderia diazotrophica TaxID=667676 RepID=A0A1H7DWP8_9BURK|nr:LysR substrate-binding domain-containing protein [Paraburkholderia diazotrophica]SEK05978.1 transcriptional regulator, LysR family [Paraburkholderia diazotrophica]
MTSADLTIRQVEAFRALIQRHTVTRAAQSLHISQPAVSRLIADFEDSVGFTLFERQQGRLVPTAEARALYEEVERAFVGLDRIGHAAQQIRAMRRGSLRVAGSPAIALELLPAAVAQFMQAHPGIDVTLLTHSASTVVDMVASGRCDVGFIAEAIPHPSVRPERLTDASMRCILPLTHRLARKRVIKAADLEGESFISFPRSFDARTAIDRVFVEQNVQRQMSVEAQLSQTIVAPVANGAGVALIDPVTAAYAKNRVAVRPFEPEIRDQLYVVRASTLPLPGIAELFCARARESLTRLVRADQSPSPVITRN